MLINHKLLQQSISSSEKHVSQDETNPEINTFLYILPNSCPFFSFYKYKLLLMQFEFDNSIYVF